MLFLIVYSTGRAVRHITELHIRISWRAFDENRVVPWPVAAPKSGRSGGTWSSFNLPPRGIVRIRLHQLCDSLLNSFFLWKSDSCVTFYFVGSWHWLQNRTFALKRWHRPRMAMHQAFQVQVSKVLNRTLILFVVWGINAFKLSKFRRLRKGQGMMQTIQML